MQYRKLGRCGELFVSEIALGCEGFLGKSADEVRKMLDRALELGINFIDMYTPNPEFRDNMGRAIAGRREKAVSGLSPRFFFAGHHPGAGQDACQIPCAEAGKLQLKDARAVVPFPAHFANAANAAMLA